MPNLEEWMRKHPNTTLHAFVDNNGTFIVRLYDLERGNHIAGAGKPTMLEAMLATWLQVKDV